MRKKGIMVAADLTPRQRDQLQHYKEQGKVAYYKNGTLKKTGVRTTRRDTQTDTQHARATRRTTSARKDNSLTPHVNAVSPKTTTTSPVTTIDTAKEATVSNTTPMLETGTVNGTHKADVAGCMT